MKKPKIVVIGSANTDMVVMVKHLPVPGETVLGDQFFTTRGGKGANQAVAAVRLGADVTLVTRLGRDTFGRELFAAYEAEGINTRFIVWDDAAPSGTALIMVDSERGENIIAVVPGANALLSPQDVQAAEHAIQAADYLLIQLEIPLETVIAAVAVAEKHQVRVILNPAPATKLPAELLNRIDTLTPNETEAVELAEEPSASSAGDAAFALRSKFKIKNLIITMGKQGALIADYRNETIPGYHVQPIDTTGAGDTFNGALTVALARGDKLIDAVKFANAAAALSTTRQGAQAAMPTSAEVDLFLKVNC